jgi:hypothetical protein
MSIWEDAGTPPPLIAFHAEASENRERITATASLFSKNLRILVCKTPFGLFGVPRRNKDLFALNGLRQSG